MNADQIREYYSCDRGAFEVNEFHFEEAGRIFQSGNPLGFLIGLIYFDHRENELPDWLFAGLVNLLLELAEEGERASSPKEFLKARNRARDFLIDKTRATAVIHIRNIQGKGQRHPATKGLNPQGSLLYLCRVGTVPDDFGKTWVEAYCVASELFRKTIYSGGADTMEKAYKRFHKRRNNDQFSASYWLPLDQLLDLPDAPPFGVM